MSGYGDINIDGLGYGDPEQLVGPSDAGYGDPFQDALIFVLLENRTVHHRGGAQVRLIGTLSDSLGPYRLSIEVDGQTTYFYSGLAGQGVDLSQKRGVLEAYSPPAPAGTYPLTLHCGPSFQLSYTVNSPLHILPDNRAQERYQIRRAPPELFHTGPRYNHLEDIDTAITKPARPPYIHIILDTFARHSRELTGRAQTVLTADHPIGAQQLNVESVYQFPPSGEILISGARYAYSVSGNTLTLTIGLKRAYAKLSEVIHV